MKLKSNIKVFSLSSFLVFTFVLSACSSSDSKETTTTLKNRSTTTTTIPKKPVLETKVLADKLTNPWDIAFIDRNTFLFTERNGNLNAYKDGELLLVSKIKDVKAQGEGGLLGLSIDKAFKENRKIYVCYNSSKNSDVRVVSYTVNKDLNELSGEKTIVSGIPAKDSGRHSGCRIRTAKDGSLFIGTGDAANASNPQSKTLLGGKILHVDTQGKGLPGNLSSPFDDRILSYGHRNVQGIALFDEPVNGVYGYSAEHGPDRDDEINLIQAGNYGWSPTGDYNENVPMTDLKKFPNAISSIWSSGVPTIATSGLTIIDGEKWGSFNGALAVAALKGEQVRIIGVRSSYSIAFEDSILTDLGRIRVVVQGPNGDLFIATDDPSNGKIIRVSPVGFEN